MLIAPALPSVKIDCDVSTVTVLPTAMVALSWFGPVGTMPHDQLPATSQLPVVGFQTQLAASASSLGRMANAHAMARASAVLLRCLEEAFMTDSRRAAFSQRPRGNTRCQ